MKESIIEIDNKFYQESDIIMLPTKDVTHVVGKHWDLIYYLALIK